MLPGLIVPQLTLVTSCVSLKEVKMSNETFGFVVGEGEGLLVSLPEGDGVGELSTQFNPPPPG